MFLLMVFLIILVIKLYSSNGVDKPSISTDLIFNNLDIELYFEDRQNILSFLTFDCTVNKEAYNSELKNSIISS